jgi:hypothetical protein
VKKLIVSALALTLAASAAIAQVNYVPQQGITSGYGFKNTYSSAFFGLASASSATDVLCIAGSASKVVRLVDIKIGGSGTAITFPVTVVRRAVLDTGGTAATTTANPGITTQIASRDTGMSPNTASTATLISYTANPTINDSAPVYIDSQALSLAAATASGSGQVDFNYGLWNEDNIAPPTLRGTTQQICVNFNATTITSPLLTGVITWTEE